MLDIRKRGKGVGRFSVELQLANAIDMAVARRGLLNADQVRRVTIQGVVDTGATRLVIPAAVAQQLGLREVGKARVRYADGHTRLRSLVDDVYVELLGRASSFQAVVEPRRSSALVGAIILESLDFVIDPTAEVLRPRDPKQIVSEIE